MPIAWLQLAGKASLPKNDKKNIYVELWMTE
jgi:hypothetical protein